tara:strand:- start:3278 stop:3640 length:363 start_codon:yes stop_codon:yes gene_type:complete
VGKKKRFMLNPKFAKSLDKYKNLKAVWASKTETKAEKAEVAEVWLVTVVEAVVETVVETVVEPEPAPSLPLEEKVVVPTPVEVVEVEKPKPSPKKKSAPKAKAKSKTKKAATKKSTRKKK